ncbi:cytochrome o ubiquinol oxidase subunit IV, partial [Francisella tularensis subsp. holarctica]|nr:cytochrome o ubiquinol oxidase subunit IV [Francisella tularensis subsp. holarctica]
MAKEHLYDHDTVAAYGTHNSYIQVFVLSVVITTIAFFLVGFKLLSPDA